MSRQQVVDAYFRTEALFWKRIYEHAGVFAAIHQERMARVLALVDDLELPRDSRVLEIGCGAGFTSVALAERGYLVEATDTVPAMIESTRELAAAAGVGGRMRVSLADVRKLPFTQERFDVVLAIGVLPWLRAIETPIAEMTRVLAPEGHLIANIDNRWGFSRLFDPVSNPALSPLRKLARAALRRGEKARAQSISRSRFEAALAGAGLRKQAGVTLGFGPFAVIGRELLPAAMGLRLHAHLQKLADRGVPVIRAGGAQYLVLARKVPCHAR